MKIIAFAILLSGLTTPLAAQWLNHPTPGIPRTADGKPNLAAPAPRTADGKPDLTGVWQRLSTYVRDIAADLKPGEVQPWAEALVQSRKENLHKEHMSLQCLPWGPSYSTSGRMAKIVQTPGLILILDEDLTYRQIFMDGRKLEADPNPSWMGYSVGHWDGDTLVVESNGYNDRTWLDRDGHPHTEALRMTERYRRRDFGHMDIEVTLSDPKVYAQPWTVALNAQVVPDTELLEAVCNESTAGHEHWVGKASDEKRTEKGSPRKSWRNTPVATGSRTCGDRGPTPESSKSRSLTVSCSPNLREEGKPSLRRSRTPSFRAFLGGGSTSSRTARACRRISWRCTCRAITGSSARSSGTETCQVRPEAKGRRETAAPESLPRTFPAARGRSR